MIALAQTLFRSRDLVWQLAWRDIRSRHKQSVIGVAWIVFQPLWQAAIFSIIFTKIVHIETPQPYPVFCFVKLVPWTFFAVAITSATNSIVNSANLVRKVAFPREVLVVSAALSALVNLVIGLAAAFVMMAVFRFGLGAESIHFSIRILWIIPLLAVTLMLALAMGFLLSAANVFFRDVTAIVPLLIQVWFYATPIIYPMSLVESKLSEGWLRLYNLNPMASVMTSFGSAMLDGASPDLGLLSMAAVVSIVLLVVAWAFFRWAERYFADVI